MSKLSLTPVPDTKDSRLGIVNHDITDSKLLVADPNTKFT
jgi:hypothetical protein